MKIKNLFIALAASVALYSCSSSDNGAAEKAKADSIAAATPVTYTVVVDSSTVNWKGSMMKSYNHNGTIKLASGSLMVASGKLTGGTFTIDMKSIAPLDSNFDKKQRKKENLVAHLALPDFFNVDSFATATFVVKSVDGATATGDLTVRGKTNEEKVTDIVIASDSVSVSATGKLVFNRQKYGVAYSTGMKDMIISDDIEITVALKGKK